MPDDIPPLPEVPEALREAAQGRNPHSVCRGRSFPTRRLPQLGRNSPTQPLSPSLTTASSLTPNSTKSRVSLPRIRLSIALALQHQSGISLNFRDLLHPQPRHLHDDGLRAYSHLSRLGKTFVTTNYDEWLDDELPVSPPPSPQPATPTATSTPRPRTVYYKPEDLIPANLNRDDSVVIHLHGSIKAPEGMILTTRHYLQHYANDRRTTDNDPENYVLTFLEHLFTHKTVLFVGYGLDELEVLEYIVEKAPTAQESGLQPRHFLLQGFYSHERALMENMRTYYREFGIQIIPFLKGLQGLGSVDSCP